ncbi:recombinase family protein [uncultured Tessaracoccus sp.]|uniref:recombinase family protein n=1 Tax=uncultured Tessaracoccus sp. TaxID=905023 RepID=UPI00263074A5|nr:recombinase family protein [uncultured Tessaracoccus sp.]
MKAVAYTYDADPGFPLVQAQEAKCELLARTAGYEVIEQVHDEAGDRSGLNRLLETANGTSFDTIVVTNVERLADNPDQREVIIDRFNLVGVTIMTVPPELDAAIKQLISDEVEAYAQRMNDENVDPNPDDEDDEWAHKVDDLIASFLTGLDSTLDPPTADEDKTD